MKTVINIKTDPQVKINAQRLAKELGIALSDVINASLRNFIRTREVYFSSIPRMTPEFEILVGKIEKDIKAGRNLSPAYSSMDDINNHLDNL